MTLHKCRVREPQLIDSNVRAMKEKHRWLLMRGGEDDQRVKVGVLVLVFPETRLLFQPRETHVVSLSSRIPCPHPWPRGKGREGKGRRGEGRTLIVVVESGDNCKSLNWCQYKTWLQLKTLMILVFWDILEITKKTCKAQQMTHPGEPCTDDTSSSWNVHMQNITTVHSLQ